MFHTKETVVRPVWPFILKCIAAIAIASFTVGVLLTTGCAASHHHRNDIVEELGASYLESQYSSSEWLLVAAKESGNQVDCRRWASAAFWLEAIAESEVEYFLWMNTPETKRGPEPNRDPHPQDYSEYCQNSTLQR